LIVTPGGRPVSSFRQLRLGVGDDLVGVGAEPANNDAADRLAAAVPLANATPLLAGDLEGGDG